MEVNEQSKRHIQELHVTEQLFRSLRFLLLEFFMGPKSHRHRVCFADSHFPVVGTSSGANRFTIDSNFGVF